MIEKLIVDCAYNMDQYPNHIVVEVEGEYYLLPSRADRRISNDLKKFRKLPKSISDSKTMHEFFNYEYLVNNLEKRSGYNFDDGRAISDKEFEDLKELLSLKEDDISEPFINEVGGIYGKKHTFKYKCIQIRVEDTLAIGIEQKLRKKGIMANNIAPGRIDIRVPE